MKSVRDCSRSRGDRIINRPTRGGTFRCVPGVPPDVTNESLVPVLATVFTGFAVLMAGLTVYARTPIPLFAGAAFGVTAGIMWYQATGRLERRMYRTARRHRGDRAGRVGRRYRTVSGRRQSTTQRTDAHRVLGVEPDADRAHIRRAYRERAKRAHPDNPDGSEVEFKRVTAAYEQLRGQ